MPPEFRTHEVSTQLLKPISSRKRVRTSEQMSPVRQGAIRNILYEITAISLSEVCDCPRSLNSEYANEVWQHFLIECEFLSGSQPMMTNFPGRIEECRCAIVSSTSYCLSSRSSLSKTKQKKNTTCWFG